MQSPTDMSRASSEFDRLIDLIRALRAENGCPWDRAQTPQSFHPYILEEYHELVQALGGGDREEIADEMGDLLFLTVFVAYMLQQEGVASLSTIVQGVVDKMTRRHPHVFGDVQANTPREVITTWSKVKAAEEPIRRRKSILDGIPRNLPALSRAQKLSRRASRTRLEWMLPEQVLPKISEELTELEDAVESGDASYIREELGDLLFVIASAAGRFDTNAEAALAEACDKFERRFKSMETELKARQRSVEDASSQELADIWNEVKSKERSNVHTVSPEIEENGD